jgi:arsenical pump membrane protein
MVDAKALIAAAAAGISLASLPLLYSWYGGWQAFIGPAVALLSTIVMSIVLESIGVFRHAAANMIVFSRGSGSRLYWCIIGLSSLLTIFFSTLASIMLITPIILQVSRMLQLQERQRGPLLIGSVLITSAAALPLGASSLSNLLAIRLAGEKLTVYAEQMFIPSAAAVLVIALLVYLLFRRSLPERIAETAHTAESGLPGSLPVRWPLFQLSLIVVVTVKAGLYIGSDYGLPIEWVSMAGAILLLAFRWLATGQGLKDIAAKTPWHILLFAFGAFVIANGLQQTGVTRFIARELGQIASTGGFPLAMATGTLLAAISGFVNHLPSLLAGTLSVQEIDAAPYTVQLAFHAGIMGSGIGAMMSPAGTLAAMMWVILLRRNQVALCWVSYMKAAAAAVPAGLLAGLLTLYAWTQIIG